MTYPDWLHFHEAIRLASKWHHGQRRKSSTDPYIVHPLRVAYLAVDSGLSYEACTAAVLHDCVEDCGIDISEIYSRFPYEVGKIVSLLTKWWPDDVTKEEKELLMVEYYNRVLLNPDAINIKLLDRIDNLKDMFNLLPKQEKWVRKYLAKTEKEFPKLYAASDNKVIKTAYDGVIELLKKRLDNDRTN